MYYSKNHEGLVFIDRDGDNLEIYAIASFAEVIPSYGILSKTGRSRSPR